VADALVRHWGLSPFRRGERARVADGEVGGVPVRVLKPTTMMNRSGAALASLRADPTFVPAKDLLIVVDDFNIPLGTWRLRPSGSAGGHNGLKSIEATLQSQEYARLRVGIGPLPSGEPWEEFVLAPFEEAEREQAQGMMPDLIKAADDWLRQGPGDGR
jgi:peptidyl-tRNA hydrolase, PTH1 family